MLTHRAATILGDIPSEWGRELLGSILKEHQGGDWGDDDGEVAVSVLRSTNFTSCGKLDFAHVATRFFKSNKASNHVLIDKDLLLERSGGGPTQPVGRIGFVPHDLPSHWFSNFVQLLRADTKKIDPEFLAWVLFELNRSGIIERLQHQTTQMRNLDFRDYLRVYLPKPNPQEQAIIAWILRTANDAHSATEVKVAAARRLKTALMQQLFTQGIPGRHKRFKHTKIGEIPQEWDVVSLKSVLDGMPFNGVSPQSREDPPGTPILNVGCISDGNCSTEKISYVDVDADTQKECRARKGDFYVLRGNGNRAYVATGGLLREEPETATIFSDKLIRLRFQSSRVVDRYVPYLWQSKGFLHRLQSKAESGSGLWMISKRDIRRELIPLPPSKDEQAEMVAIIDLSITSIDAVEKEVQALERLKRSLLQNLLTGKVRVKPLETSP